MHLLYISLNTPLNISFFFSEKANPPEYIIGHKFLNTASILAKLLRFSVSHTGPSCSSPSPSFCLSVYSTQECSSCDLILLIQILFFRALFKISYLYSQMKVIFPSSAFLKHSQSIHHSFYLLPFIISSFKISYLIIKSNFQMKV